MHISNFWNIVPVWSSKSSCPQHVFDCLQLLRLRLPFIYPTSKDKFDIGVQHYMLRYENDSRLPKNISRWTVDCSISFGVWHTVPYITTVKEKRLTNNSCYWITWKKKFLVVWSDTKQVQAIRFAKTCARTKFGDINIPNSIFFDGIALHMYLQLETLLVVLINKKDSGNRRSPSSELLFLHVGRIISSCVTIVLPSEEINIEK